MAWSKIKSLGMVVLGIAVSTSCFWLLLSHAGMNLQARFLATSVAASATVLNVSTERVKDFHLNRTGGTSIREWRVYLDASYQVNGTTYKGRYKLKAFDFSGSNVRERTVEANAKKFALNFLQTVDHETVYYDPKNPSSSVLNQADEIHLGFVFPMLLLATFFVCFTLYQCAMVFRKGSSQPSAPPSDS